MRPTAEMERMRMVIAQYVEQNGVTNTRDIAEYVCSVTGMNPSTGTVSKILQDFGYLPHRQPSFVWRHNKPR